MGCSEMANKQAVECFEDLRGKIKYGKEGLIPAIIQDAASQQVLMMAYMNEESLKFTLEKGETHFFSRSRQELWHKGATSGHTQKVKKGYYDCDGDTLLFLVEQKGVACHTGAESCFHNLIAGESEEAEIGAANLGTVLEQVFQVIKGRQQELPEGSYTTYLFTKGQDKILKKIAEEAGEVIIGSKNNDNGEVVYEASDLIYHLMVLLAYHGLTLADIGKELDKRR